MIQFTNENILNLIIDSLVQSKTKEMLNRVNNRILSQLLIRQITYLKIFKSFSILNKKTLNTRDESSKDTLALLSNGNLVSSSVKGIKVFDLSNYQCIKDLDGKYNFKSTLLLPNENLLIASYDKSLMFYIKGNFEFDNITLEKDIYELNDLFLISNNHVACTGVIKGEKYIFIFDNNFNCIKEIKLKKCNAPTPNPFANLNHGKLAYGSDGNIKICDINNNYNEYTNIEVEKNSDIYTLLSINKFNLLISGTFLDLKVWETNTFQCLYTIKTPNVTKLLSMPNGFVAVGFKNGEIRILDALRNKIINTFQGHSGKILSLALTKDNKLISKCSYYNIIVWS
jgi:hypothetical protein